MIEVKLKKYWNLATNSMAKQRWRRTHFLVPNKFWGSSITRGFQISDQLNKLGIYSCVFETSYGSKDFSGIKNSIFIISKIAIQDNFRILEQLKRNENVLVWDPMDGLLDLKDDPAVQLMDGVILSNKKCEPEVRSFFNKECRFAPMHHHWDPRCRPNHAKEYKLMYLGDTTPENIRPEYIERIKDINIAKVSGAKSVKLNNLFAVVMGYNCHFSVREEGSDSFKLKPNVKVSFASATHSNIILSRDYSNLELLDAAYPYYTDTGLDCVLKVVEYSKETFGTKVWNNALDMMRAVRERTTIKQVSKDYIQFLSSFG